MAVQSKFYQVTDQILLEYKTDQYTIIMNNNNCNKHPYIMYVDEYDDQYCLLDENIKSGLYRSPNGGYYYGGINSHIEIANNNTLYPYGHDIYVENSDFQIGTLIEDKNGIEERESQFYQDTIRLYILTGYIMNNIGGYAVKVKTKIIKASEQIDDDNTLVQRIDKDLYLLNWYMPKEELKDHIHWLENPLYLNSKFYDRYIEIKLPSSYDIANNQRDIDYVYEYEDEDEETYYLRGIPDKSSNVIIEFATVQQENIKLEDKTNSLGPSTFILDNVKEMSIYAESNANNFGVKLYEDVNTHSIIYYPTYGDGINTQPVDLTIMGRINTGEIPMINYSELDSANDNIDEFLEMYGSYDELPCKWIIINELSVKYIYDKIVNNLNEESVPVSYTDFYTNTIDYSFKHLDDGDFYISKFVPYIKERLNMSCKSIFIQYSCHLYNRANNTDIVRQASMSIKNPYKYVLSQIETTNITNYKIVNKIEKANTIVSTGNQQSVNSKIIKEFYDVTELVANDGSENIYAQGKLTLKLNHSGSNYLIKLYAIGEDNTRVPYDLTGPWKYKLVFPSVTNNMIEIFANLDNDKTNYGNGSLSFYISKDRASAIMSVPISERYFSLMIDNDEAENSVIYEGKVDWKA